MSIVPATDETDRRRSTLFDPFALDLFDSFLDFPFSGPPFSRAFPELDHLGFGFGGARRRNSRFDWSETSEAHILRASLPGFAGEDVLVELVDDRALQISTDSGSFSTRFKLPDNARIEQMRVFMTNGVLTVAVPKDGAQAPRSPSVRVVEITGED